MRQWGSGVAQLAERSLPIPEVRSSNPVIAKILQWTFFTVNCWKDENKEKRGLEWPNFFKKSKHIIRNRIELKRLMPSLHLLTKPEKFRATASVPIYPCLYWKCLLLHNPINNKLIAYSKVIKLLAVALHRPASNIGLTMERLS